MPIVNPSQSAAGETIEAADINNPINQLAAVLNGGIDSTNLADSSVTTSKIAAGTQVATRAQNPYKFSAYRSGAWNMSGSSWNKVNFDTKEYDTGTNFDNTSTFRFTAPIAGFYMFNAAVSGQGISGNTYIAALYRNGGLYKYGTQINIASTVDFTVTVAPPPLLLAANDTIEVYVFNGNGATQLGRTGGTSTYFGGFLVSAT